jgi:hypothetical protein
MVRHVLRQIANQNHILRAPDPINAFFNKIPSVKAV